MLKETLMDYINQLKPISGTAGDRFPSHDVPETTISVQEHLGNMDEGISPDVTRAQVLENIVNARVLFGLGVFSMLTPRSPRTAIALIEHFASRLQELMDNQAEEIEVQRREALQAGYELAKLVSETKAIYQPSQIILPAKPSKGSINSQKPLLPLILVSRKELCTRRTTNGIISDSCFLWGNLISLNITKS